MESSNQGAVETMEQTKVHPFERAGLGTAPFKFVRTYESKYQAIPGDPNCPIQPGSSCDYCATSIMQVCVIRGACGREFKVGCDCVEKVGRSHDRKLMTAAEKAKRGHGRKVRKALAAKKQEQLSEVLADDAVRAKLTTQPHPNAFLATQGATLLDWAEWMVAHSGAAGRARTLKAVKAAVA